MRVGAKGGVFLGEEDEACSIDMVSNNSSQ